MNLFSKLVSLSSTPFDLRDEFIHKYDFQKPNKQLHPFDTVYNDDKLFYNKKNEKEEDFFEKINHDTLFTSMVSKTITNDFNMIGSYFDLPDLPNDMNNYSWQFPNNKSFEWINYESLLNTNGFSLKPKITNDEGFYSNDTTPITRSCVSINNDHKVELDDIWDKALELDLPEYNQWETRNW